MNTVEEIESAILRLPPQELHVLREWFAQLDAELWDQQFERDVMSGKLDQLAAQAIRDVEQGRCREL